MNILEFRKQYPQYDNVDDDTLSTALHEKYYSHVPYEDFATKFLEKPVESEVKTDSDQKGLFEKLGQAGRGIGVSIKQGYGDLVKATKAMTERESPVARSKYLESLDIMADEDLLPEEAYGLSEKERVEFLTKEKKTQIKEMEDLIKNLPEMPEQAFKGPVLGTIEKAARGMTRYAPGMAASVVNPYVGFITTVGQLYGDKHHELKEKGVDPKVADEAAAIHGLLSGGIEFAGNITQLKGAWNILEATAKKTGLGNVAIKYAKNLIFRGAIPEGTEEFFQQYTEAAADVWAEMPEAPMSEKIEAFNRVIASEDFKKARWEAAGIGAVGGMLIPGAAGVIKAPFDVSAAVSEQKAVDKLKPEERQTYLQMKETPGITKGDLKEYLASKGVTKDIPTKITAEVSEDLDETFATKPEEATGKGLGVGLSKKQEEFVRTQKQVASRKRKAEEKARREQQDAVENEQLRQIKVAQEMRRLEQAEEERRRLHQQALDRQYFINAMIKPKGLLNVTPELMDEYEVAGDPTIHKKLKPIAQTHEFLDTGSDNLAKGVSLLSQMRSIPSRVTSSIPFKLQHVHGRLIEELDNRVQELKQQKAKEETDKLRQQLEKAKKKPEPIPEDKKAAKRKQPAAKPVQEKEPALTPAAAKKKITTAKQKAETRFSETRQKLESKRRAAETRARLRKERLEKEAGAKKKKLVDAAHMPLGMMGKYAAFYNRRRFARRASAGISERESRELDRAFAKARKKTSPVQAAAIRTKDGKVYTGPSHVSIMVDNPQLTEKGLKDAEDGFVTNSGRFVTRSEVAKLAKLANIKTATAEEAVSEDFENLRKANREWRKKLTPKQLPKYAAALRREIKDYRPKWKRDLEERGRQLDEELSRDLDKIKIPPIKPIDTVRELAKLANDVGPNNKATEKKIDRASEKEAKRMYYDLRMHDFKKTFQHAADINIVGDHKDLPTYLSKQMEEEKVTHAYAVFDPNDGGIYVLSENNPTVAEAKLYAFHELGHYTFSDVFGKDADPILKRVGIKYRGEVTKRIKDRGYDKLPRFNRMETDYRKREAEEVLIDKFLANEDPGIVQRVKDMFDRLAQRADMESISDTEIRKIVTRMRKSLQDQRQPAVAADDEEWKIVNQDSPARVRYAVPKVNRALATRRKFVPKDVTTAKMKQLWPKFVHSEDEYIEMVKEVDRLNPKVKSWYNNHQKVIKDIFGPDADLFNVLLGITSPRVGPDVNTQFAVESYLYILGKRNKPNSMSPNILKRKIDSWLRGEYASPFTKSGEFKAQEFTRALLGDRNATVLDRWMNRVFFGGAGNIDADAQAGVYAHAALRHMLIRLAKRMTKETGRRWYPNEIQANLWVYIRSKIEGLDIAKSEYDFQTSLKTPMKKYNGKTPIEYLTSKINEENLKQGPAAQRLGFEKVRFEFSPVSRLEKKRLLHFKKGGLADLKKVTGAASLKKYIDQMEASKYNYMLTIPTLKELQGQIKDGAVVYTTKDGKAGYVLHNGDIQKVYNNSDTPGLGKALLVDAITKGGRTLDAFDPYLPTLYQQFGFVETGRDRFNSKYAPPNWPYEKFKEQPDVVYMKMDEAFLKEITDAKGNVKENRVRDSIGGFKSDWDRISPYRKLDRKERSTGGFAQGIQALRTGVDQGKQRGAARADAGAGGVLIESVAEAPKKFAAKYATPRMSREQYIEGLRNKFKSTGSSGINYVETVVVRETGDQIKREVDAIEYLDVLNKEKSDLQSILDCMASG